MNMMLTIGGFLLLSVLIISANSFILQNETLAIESQFVMAAESIGQSIINEAKVKSFDEKTVASRIFSPSNLTPVASLGPDAGEVFSKPDTISNNTYKSAKIYDDIDDYNGYTRIVNTTNVNGYLATVTVTYASPTYPDSASAVPTFCKKMTVTVTNTYISIPIILSYSFTY
jgi:hypothetical protein